MLPEEGQILTGPQFNEPVRVEAVKVDGPGGWVLGVVGTKTESFRRVTLTQADLAQIATQSATLAFDCVLAISAYEGTTREPDRLTDGAPCAVPTASAIEAKPSLLSKLASPDLIWFTRSGPEKTRAV